MSVISTYDSPFDNGFSSFAIGTSASNHTVEFAKAAATEEAHRAALLASCGLAKTAATVFLDPALYESAWADFRKGKPQ